MDGSKELSSDKHNQGFTGTLKVVQLDDLIQMCCLSGATITIQVDNETQQGRIFIQDGDIIHAHCGEISGEEAFYAIMTWHNGGFETLDGVPEIAVTIKANYQYLLLEAARRSDESSQIFKEDEVPAVPADIVSVETAKLRVLMVEDSTIMAKIMSTMLLVAGDIEIAGIARNGKEALEMMELLQFDVILLDVNMPVMDGRVAIKHIMIKSPCPIVIMSNVSSRAPETVLPLLDLGAVDFISKPVGGRDFLLQQQKIVERIRRSAKANTSVFRRFRNPQGRQAPAAHQKAGCSSLAAKRLVIISSGGSGHGALYHLVAGMPEANRSAFVCLNSIPVLFLTAMSAHLNRLCHHMVTPIADGTTLHSGCFYLDSQRRSLLLQATDNSVQVRSLQEEHDSEYGPSYFDLFLFSAADVFQDRLLVILLSGAETGNLEGLRYVREEGGSIFGQSHSSCMISDFLTQITQEKLIDEELRPEALANQVVTWAHDRNV